MKSIRKELIDNENYATTPEEKDIILKVNIIK